MQKIQYYNANKKNIFILKKSENRSKSNEKRLKTIIFSFLQFDDLSHLPI